MDLDWFFFFFLPTAFSTALRLNFLILQAVLLFFNNSNFMRESQKSHNHNFVIRIKKFKDETSFRHFILTPIIQIFKKIARLSGNLTRFVIPAGGTFTITFPFYSKNCISALFWFAAGTFNSLLLFAFRYSSGPSERLYHYRFSRSMVSNNSFSVNSKQYIVPSKSLKRLIILLLSSWEAVVTFRKH